MGPLEYIYFLGYRAKTSHDLSRIQELPAKVLSVGNITTGGTGKTPATISIAREAARKGRRPCILTRGYGGRIKGPFIVSSEMYVRDVGDEAMLISEALGDVPVIKCADRYAGGMFAIENLHTRPDLFILDDGFQHRRLKRDLDMLLINSMNPFSNNRLLPLGRLREPMEETVRADAILFTKCDTMRVPDRTLEIVRKHNPTARVFASRHKPSYIRKGNDAPEDITSLRGRRLYAVAGIAEPESFVNMLKGQGAEITGTAIFRDHHRFSAREVLNILRDAERIGSDWIITTEKDIMRLRPYADAVKDFTVLGIELEAEADFYEYIFGSI